MSRNSINILRYIEYKPQPGCCSVHTPSQIWSLVKKCHTTYQKPRSHPKFIQICTPLPGASWGFERSSNREFSSSENAANPYSSKKALSSHGVMDLLSSKRTHKSFTLTGVIIYHQPNTIIGEIRQNHHTFALFYPPQIGNLMAPI